MVRALEEWKEWNIEKRWGKRKATLMAAITLAVVLGPIGIIYYQMMHNTFVYYFMVADDEIIASDGRGPYRDGTDGVYYGRDNIALIAVAKKLLKIVWHLLVTGEEYVEREYVKKTVVKSRKEAIKLALVDAIPLLRQAGYVVEGPV